MANNGTFMRWKSIIYEMRDNNGNFRTMPIGSMAKQKLSSDRIRLIQLTIKLMLDTEYLKPCTRMYLSEEGISAAKVYKRMLDDPNIDTDGLTEKALIVRIYRDQEKIDKMLGTDFVDKVCYGVGNISIFFERVAKAYAEISDNNLRDKLALDIPQNNISSVCDRDEFMEFVGVIMPYLKSHMDSITNGLNTNAVGYFNYLLNSPTECLDDDAQADKKYLVSILTGDVDTEEEILVD